MIKHALIMMMLFGIGFGAKAAVWTEENQWSEAWEQSYKDWLRTNASKNFFASEKKPNGQPNPYYGIRVDCADLVYSNRIIFSYENKLPFSMVNPVSPRGALVTNQLTRFDKTPEGIQRLRKFLIWAYDLVGSSSIVLDTYSIPFKDVGTGTIIVTTKKNHHSWTIVDISKTGNPTLIFNSTVGRESGFEIQKRETWPNPAWVFEPEVDKNDETKSINIYKPGSYAGFRYWRPLEFLKLPELQVPGYSEEQHTVGIAKWRTLAQKAKAKMKEKVDEVVMRLLKDACADFQQRIDNSKTTEIFKSNLAADFAAGKTAEQSSYINDFMKAENRPNDPRCLTYDKFDELSTPSRDKRFVDALILARTYFKAGLKKFGEKAFSIDNLKTYKSIYPTIELSAADEAIQDRNSKTNSNFCSLKINDTLGELSLAEMKRRFFMGRFSSNPNEATTGRFGYAKTKDDLASQCDAYDFVQKSYNLKQIEQEVLKEVLASETMQ
jgi:hypothetical protein